MVSLLRWFQKNPPLESSPKPEPTFTFPIIQPSRSIYGLLEQLEWELPDTWANSVTRFIHEEGLSPTDMVWLAAVAHANKDIPLESKFRYFYGCCWRVVTGTTTDERRIRRAIERY